MQVIPYLGFNGDCAQAFRFYETALGAKIEAMMTFGQMPGEYDIAPEHKDRIAHAAMSLGGHKIMGGDAPPSRYQPMTGFNVNLQVETETEAETLFAALAEGGSVHMPIGETFWAKRFGLVTDRFGTPWMVNCAKPM